MMRFKISFLVGLSVLAMFLSVAEPSQAATYYVRTDGGTSTQCTGTTDAAYSGSGTAQPCAFNHPFWVLSAAGSPNKMVGGDTLIIGPGQYMMGFGAPNTPSCSEYYPWDCRMRPVPSGTASNPTRILGKGWDTGCTSKPQIWGTERAATVVDLTGSSNVQIQCLDITDHSSCMDSGPDSSTVCNRNTYPYGPWALVGLVASDSANVILKNVSIHGLRTGILAGRISNWTLEKTNIIANSFVGWDGDIGASTSSNSGTIKFKDSRIMWNGCGETYPGLTPHHCYSQDQGGYGDGIGTNVTGGDWIFDGVDFTHNTSDGLDLLYHNGQGSVTISRSRFEGNAGNQVKTSASTTISNSKIIGSCAFFKDKSFTSTTGIGSQSVAFNNCRAGGNTIAIDFRSGMTAAIYNSTITGNGDVLIQSSGNSCAGTEKITSQNNIYIGGLEYNTGGSDVADLYYAAGAGGNGDGACGKVAFSTVNDIIWATKYNTSECTGKASFCVDPKIVGPLSYFGDNQNVSLQSSSPAIGKGIVLSLLPSIDFNNFSRGSLWDIGAVEYGSIPQSSGGSTPTQVCGNSVIEGTEVCDGAALGGKSCSGLGFTGGTLSCSSSCQLNTSACTSASTPVCGNKVIESGESCDGTTLGGKTCSSLGFTGGTLSCSSTCQLNTTACTNPATTTCGNRTLEAGEQCETGTLNGQSCASLGFSGGSLGCTGSCQFNTSACTSISLNVCGNKILEDGEQCEVGTLNGESCLSLGYSGGSLGCSKSCQYNTSACTVSASCGNAVIDSGEQCDSWRLNRKSCQSLGYSSGTLRCNNHCGYDESGCIGAPAAVCGNRSIENGEECEVGTLNGQSCASLGFSGGSLGCSGSCKFNTSSCTKIELNVCGNKILEKGEQCEVGTLNGYSCSTLGFASGSLGCSSSCQFNLSGCK